MEELFYFVLTLAILEGVFGIKVSSAMKDAATNFSQGQPFSEQVGTYFGGSSAIPGDSGEASEKPEGSQEATQKEE